MLPPRKYGGVGDLPIVGGGRRVAQWGTAARERTQYIDRWTVIAIRVAQAGPQILEACFVDCPRADRCGLGGLHRVFGSPLVVSAGWQAEIAYPLIVEGDAQFLISHGQRVLSVNGVVEARAQRGPHLRRGQGLIDVTGLRLPSSVVASTNAFSLMLRRSASNVNEALLPPQRSTEVEAVDLCTVRRPRGLGEQRIARVQALVVVLCEGLAVQQVAAGLGEDLDARETGTVVLRGKRIGVDPHLADTRLRRQASSGEAIDEELAATRAGRGTGQGLQL